MAKKKPTIDQLLKWCKANPDRKVQRGAGMVTPVTFLLAAIPAAVAAMQEDASLEVEDVAEPTTEGGEA